MAIFGSKTKEKKVTKKAEKAVAVVETTIKAPLKDIIIAPRVTEKSGIMSQNGVYTFEITSGANKQEVAQAVKALYKVTPIKVNVINVPSKNVFVRGKKGVVSGMRKAVVTLKKGDTINFV